MTGPDDYLLREHVITTAPPKFATIDKAYEMLKRGASRAEVVRASGLSALQVGELKERIKRA